jgi:hypothetical protein
MIYEYALQPELVCTWTNHLLCSLIKGQFGLDRGRLVSRYPSQYPSQWKELVVESYERNASRRPDTQKERAKKQWERKRLEELLQRLGEVFINRDNPLWTNDLDWLSNAVAEHKRGKFRAILASENVRDVKEALTINDLHDHNPLWSIPQGGIAVSRDPEKMANVVAPLLKSARNVIFVDPHFQPNLHKNLEPLKLFLKIMAASQNVTKKQIVEIHCNANKCGEYGWFKEECESQLPDVIPNNMKVTIFYLQEKNGGEALHNRYILTEIGGIGFGYGLDKGNKGQNDDLYLMGSDQLTLRWSQYANKSAFNIQHESIPIIGKA